MHKLLLLDGMNLSRRFFHGMQDTSMAFNQTGEPVATLIGWVNAHIRLVNMVKPDHIICVFDDMPSTRRLKLHPDYKAHRAEKPEAFSTQLPWVKDLSDALGAVTIDAWGGFEADDILASMAVKQVELGGQAWIVSSDKDFCCLLMAKGIHIINPNDWKEVTRTRVKEKWGIKPELHHDLLALMGDSSDGYPGVPGIGPKKAAALLNTYGGWRQVYERINEMPPSKMKEALIANEEIVRRNAKLAAFIPINIPNDFREPAKSLNLGKAMQILRDRGLYTHCAKVSELSEDLALHGAAGH